MWLLNDCFLFIVQLLLAATVEDAEDTAEELDEDDVEEGVFRFGDKEADKLGEVVVLEADVKWDVDKGD
jgi:hypothetical protein